MGDFDKREAHPPTGCEDFLEREHPKNRPSEPEDPMMMSAGCAAGDPLAMLDGIVEEYARMGWDADRIKQLFDRPFFQATYGLKQTLGERAVAQRIDETLHRCGVFRVTVSSSDRVYLDIARESS